MKNSRDQHSSALELDDATSVGSTWSSVHRAIPLLTSCGLALMLGTFFLLIPGRQPLHADHSAANVAPLGPRVFTETIVLTPTQDNTLYEDLNGGLSNGGGEYLFVGQTNDDDTRRTILMFDLRSAVAEDAQVVSATVRLQMSRSFSGDEPVALHEVLATWGEGSADAPLNEGQGTKSDEGAATWIHREYSSTLWTTPGGDYTETVTAVAQVGASGVYSWTSEKLLDDVVGWLDNPDSNYGWILLGNEEEIHSAKRFNSRENQAQATRPMLIVTVRRPGDPPGQKLYLPMISG